MEGSPSVTRRLRLSRWHWYPDAESGRSVRGLERERKGLESVCFCASAAKGSGDRRGQLQRSPKIARGVLTSLGIKRGLCAKLACYANSCIEHLPEDTRSCFLILPEALSSSLFPSARHKCSSLHTVNHSHVASGQSPQSLQPRHSAHFRRRFCSPGSRAPLELNMLPTNPEGEGGIYPRSGALQHASPARQARGRKREGVR